MTLSKQAQHERLIQDLKASKEQFEKRGWVKEALVTEQGVCALGAIGCATLRGFHNAPSPYSALKESARAMAVVEAVAKQMPLPESWGQAERDFCNADDLVMDTNDDIGTTYRDIVTFFDKALAEAGGLA